MPDFTVREIQNQHLPYFGTDQRLHNATRVGITIGGFGPFYNDFYPPNDDAVHINQWKQQMVDKLRATQGS
jgi:hypothetical protein